MLGTTSRAFPVSLVPQFGKKFWKTSFGQVSQAEAIKFRALEDVKFDAHIPPNTRPLARDKLTASARRAASPCCPAKKMRSAATEI
ncbi:hypothetical protein [Gemmobacter serpentinus]|uniref:hypothetical protein n=1 Tax=Gemmobacter serpentinus TaxID=2652247 RepID=UPI00124E2C4E|nr:hypothetical protein [Gemmobacter serpentinus]